MDRMQPPPNYYGAPYNGFGPNMGPNNPMPNPQMPPNMPNPGGMPPMGGPQMQPVMADPSQIPPPPIQSNNYENDDLYTETNNNRGKKLRVYCSFTDSSKWHDVIFEGILVYGVADHICVKTKDDIYTIIVGIYINYIEYLEKPAIPGFR